jgi:hypothetical protein
MEESIRELIKQVSPNMWIVGPLKLHCSKGFSDTSTWYDEGDDLSYTVTSAPIPLPSTEFLSANQHQIKLVYDIGHSSAVWSVGNNAFCKVKVRMYGTTPEAEMLAFLSRQRPDFEFPKVLHQAEHNARSYLFLSRVRGRTLADAWPTLNEAWRNHYTNAIVSACRFLESPESDKICGVDGKNLFDPFFIKHGAKEDYSPPNLQQGCKLMGMDCSKFVFYHADLAPGNIIVEDVPESGVVGIIGK